MPKAKVTNPASTLSAPQYHDEEAAIAHLEAQRWPDGEPVCPHCGSPDKVYRQNADKVKTTVKKYRKVFDCGVCNKQFSVTVGTIFEDSKVPLHKWLLAVHLLSSAKNGCSSKELQRHLQVTYKTAWFMSHRIRKAMEADSSDSAPLGGEGKTVEVDETYYAGRRHRHGTKSGTGDRMKIVSLVERGGKVRSHHVTRVTGKTVKTLIKDNVQKGTQIMTDDSVVYRCMKSHPHKTIRHSRWIYVRGDVHTNTVEGFFGHFKRGISGTYVSVSEQHINRYATEFDFRYNTRELEDSERTALVLRKAEGKRLAYYMA